MNQIELIAAITKEVDRQSPGLRLVARQFNAIIEAANLIGDALAKPYQPAQANSGYWDWLKSDDVGASSKFMAHRLGKCIPAVPYAYPYDAGDFERCVKLLLSVPEWRPYVHRMKETGKEWARICDVWEELEKMWTLGMLASLTKRLAELVNG